MMLSDVLVFAFLGSGLVFLFFLLRAAFVKGRRRKSLVHSAAAFSGMILAIVGIGLAMDQEARDEGYLGTADRRKAIDAGYADPLAWAAVREGMLATQRSEDEAAAAARELQDHAIAELVSFASSATEGLPDFFRDHGNLIPENARMRPLAPDVVAYARFYWTVDAIETNCQFLGQRPNIEMLSPRDGVKSWLSTAEAYPHHPDHAEYLRIFQTVEQAVRDLGEDAVCPAMYGLLGPDGTLMDEALTINQLIDPTIINRWRVRVEDGVLWSSRDYCERRYYLEESNMIELHENACAEAEIQSF